LSALLQAWYKFLDIPNSSSPVSVHPSQSVQGKETLSVYSCYDGRFKCLRLMIALKNWGTASREEIFAQLWLVPLELKHGYELRLAFHIVCEAVENMGMRKTAFLSS
jgi:hypothetical protein